MPGSPVSLLGFLGMVSRWNLDAFSDGLHDALHSARKLTYLRNSVLMGSSGSGLEAAWPVSALALKRIEHRPVFNYARLECPLRRGDSNGGLGRLCWTSWVG